MFIDRASGQLLTPPQVLFQDTDILVIEKPAGLAFHRGEEHIGVTEWLRVAQAQGALEPGELFPVHRLDKITSGCLLLARTSEAAQDISAAFVRREVQKLYLGLSVKKPKKKQGQIIGDMVRSRRRAWKLLRTREDPARTRFVSFGLSSVRQGLRLYLLKPETGRTHQLRVAMKSIGAPVLGDGLYAAQEEAQHEERAYLHAWALRLPFRGRWMTFHSIPEEGSLFLEPALRTLCSTWDDLGFGWFPDRRDVARSSSSAD